MNRRKFLQSLVLIPLSTYIKLDADPLSINAAENTTDQISRAGNSPSHSHKRILIETVPIAGFQYYKGESLWHELKINDTLSLIRETENKADENAIILKWKGEKLGYIPRLDNQTIAELMDEGKTFDAKIIKLSKSKNPWSRVEVALYQIV